MRPALPFIAEKIEGLIFSRWATDGGAELIEAQRVKARRSQKIAGVDLVIAQILID